MDRATLLALMDLNMVEMYREMARTTPGGWIQERDGLVLCGSPDGSMITNMAMPVDEVDGDTLRRVTDEVFRRHEIPFSVWTRAHADAALEGALRAGGWTEITTTPGMVFHPGDGPAVAPPSGAEIREARDARDLAAFGSVMEEAYAVYGTPVPATREKFRRLGAIVGPTTQGYLCWAGGRAVAGAILYMSHGIAGVGWVGTHPEAFRRGYGAAATWAVVAEGLRRGAPFVNLQAAPMGTPVYARMGFSTPTSYRVFVA